ncbi:zinc finger and SCAN domain-containing protein 1-like [Cyprinus carpio]|uniref:Zinc finger and SCAN domain-containing protein 1-like n=1 Tax=Cyprinus carpio TaxID=7962 RepID=A0A9Q9XVD8_CYPCA|nr:zinc finger and SCAN domain-containing protein 1-like [Cyprinus carpio]
MFRSWVDQEVRAIPSSKDSTSPLPLNKMGPQDDPEAFLDLFEKSAEARGWPPGEWPMRLIPLLSGEAQVAAHQLPVQKVQDPDPGRAQQLRDSCRKWLMADSSDVEDVIDRVVLEQFVAKLPRKTAQWVQCHRPTSLNQAIQLAEDQMVACPGVGDPLPSATLSLFPSPLPLQTCTSS